MDRERGVANQKASAPSIQQTPRIGGFTMDAKYNWIIDNSGIRMAINITVFAMWLGACAVLLSL